MNAPARNLPAFSAARIVQPGGGFLSRLGKA